MKYERFVWKREKQQTIDILINEKEEYPFRSGLKMMFSGLKKTGITQNSNNGVRKRERYPEV